MSLRAVIYARRSQDHQEDSVPRQVQLATEFIAEKGWSLVKVYADAEGAAGRKEFLKRKEFLG